MAPMPAPGTAYRVQVDLLGVFDRGPRLWVCPGGPPFRGAGTPRPAGGAGPAPSRGPNGRPRVVAQPAKRWTVERPARRTGATRRGPRPPGATRGHAQA